MQCQPTPYLSLPAALNFTLWTSHCTVSHMHDSLTSILPILRALTPCSTPPASPLPTSLPQAPLPVVPTVPQVPAAALPADAYVVASPCSAAAAAPGAAATAVFTVGASVNPEVFKEVALQVDFPKALYPSAKLTCQTSTAQGKHQQCLPMLTACVDSDHMEASVCICQHCLCKTEPQHLRTSTPHHTSTPHMHSTPPVSASTCSLL
jgi:hypothetical protein